MNFNTAIKSLTTSFFPDICYICGERKAADMHLCAECAADLPVIKPPFCPGCGGENDGIFDICSKCLKEEKRPWKKAVAAMNYKDSIRQAVKDFKYNRRTHFARLLGELAAKAWKEQGGRADCVVPVPMHWTRRIFRGYNQTELLASVFSRASGVPMAKLLRRVRRTPKQANLSREERKKNLRGAFKISGIKRDFRKTQSILLLDDVLTTGATLEAASETLLKSGICTEVNIIVIARG